MGKRKGCYQCTKRRIICDMTEPQCLKCIHKELNCSGNGIRYRFNDGVASRGKLRGFSIPVIQNTQQDLLDERSDCREREDLAKVRQAAGQRLSPDKGPCGPVSQEVDEFHVEILPCLESTDSQVRLLLDYFSSTIAPGMVIIDGHNNGYRNLILSLAVQNKLVQQAVLSVAGFHLWRNNPGMRSTAEISRARVIQQLKTASMADSSAVFSVSTWIMVLVLLVGELILGGEHYCYLLRMTGSLMANGVHDYGSLEMMFFLHRQTELLSTLAQPFMHSSSGDETTERSLESLLLESPEFAASEGGQDIVNTVTHAFRICSQIYRSRALFKQDQNNTLRLDRLKHLISQIYACSPGGKSLVWVYFIGAAESELNEHRTFFANGLVDIYRVTGCANIATGLSMLEQIWQRQSEESWTRILPVISTTFVM